jgi:hypothetical protein
MAFGTGICLDRRNADIDLGQMNVSLFGPIPKW